MIRLFIYDNNEQYEDFEDFLFSQNGYHEITFDFPNDKVTIDTVDYRISTIIYDGENELTIPQQLDYTSGYKIARIDDSTATEYYGKINADGKWYILKISSNNYTYANGLEDFTTNWNNRESLEFFEFNELTWS